MEIEIIRTDDQGLPKLLGRLDGNGFRFGNGHAEWPGPQAEAIFQVLGHGYMVEPFELRIGGRTLSNCRIWKTGGIELLGGVAMTYG